MSYNGIFAGISGAQVTKQGVYLEPGSHILKVERCKLQQSQKNASKWFFVAELTVIDTDNPRHYAGQQVTWLQDMDKPNRQGAQGNVKAFAVAFDPAPGANVTEDEMLTIISDKNPLAGLRVRAFGILLDTKSGGKFTKFNWDFCAADQTLSDFGVKSALDVDLTPAPAVSNGVAPPAF